METMQDLGSPEAMLVPKTLEVTQTTETLVDLKTCWSPEPEAAQSRKAERKEKSRDKNLKTKPNQTNNNNRKPPTPI